MPLPAKEINLTERQKANFRRLLSECVPDKNGCMIWQGCVDNHGRASFGTKNFIAARVLYALTWGQLDSNECVCHTCDNPRCMSLNHLWIGRHKDNMKDMRDKGRRVSGRVSYNGLYKETVQQEGRILSLRKEGYLVKEIANKVGLCVPTIMKVLLRHPIVCGLCGKKYKTLKGLGMHITRHHRHGEGSSS